MANGNGYNASCFYLHGKANPTRMLFVAYESAQLVYLIGFTQSHCRWLWQRLSCIDYSFEHGGGRNAQHTTNAAYATTIDQQFYYHIGTIRFAGILGVVDLLVFATLITT
jgi:hypothetical protein